MKQAIKLHPSSVMNSVYCPEDFKILDVMTKLEKDIFITFLNIITFIHAMNSHYLNETLPFVKSWQSLSWVRNFHYFMKYKYFLLLVQLYPIMSRLNPVHTLSY
jgi:hypothetical protein